MKAFNILTGTITILMFIFFLFPSSLERVKNMDSYRLGVLIILVLCLIYWAYFLIMSLIQHRNPMKVLMNLKENPRVIRNPDDGYWYLIEGNTCSHIPDPETLLYLERYLGFSRAAVKTMTTDEIGRKFKIEKQLPSIRLHFPKIEHNEKTMST